MNRKDLGKIKRCIRLTNIFTAFTSTTLKVLIPLIGSQRHIQDQQNSQHTVAENPIRAPHQSAQAAPIFHIDTNTSTIQDPSLSLISPGDTILIQQERLLLQALQDRE